jgi:hypothetical protein
MCAHTISLYIITAALPPFDSCAKATTGTPFVLIAKLGKVAFPDWIFPNDFQLPPSNFDTTTWSSAASSQKATYNVSSDDLGIAPPLRPAAVSSKLEATAMLVKLVGVVENDP